MGFTCFSCSIAFGAFQSSLRAFMNAGKVVHGFLGPYDLCFFDDVSSSPFDARNISDFSALGNAEAELLLVTCPIDAELCDFSGCAGLARLPVSPA
jgi:hypothetical protein